jgi:hypothetical protein
MPAIPLDEEQEDFKQETLEMDSSNYRKSVIIVVVLQ